MPNIGAVLKQEITRLARKETRSQVGSARKALAQMRRQIATLKRQVSTLERQLAVVGRRTSARIEGATATKDASPPKTRFAAKGLKSQRAGLGLSASEFGRLVGVSAQSVYNWEQGHAVPRASQLAVIAKHRGIGKREAKRLLGALDGAQARGSKRQKR
ncbi:MAG: helix-turn-helix transcriptional regulator [Betaproteobacteria bacterium]